MTNGGLFGQNNQAQQGGGLFGSKPAGTTGGLFGNNTQQQQPANGGLFGSKPAGTGLSGGTFNGNSSAPTGGLFGNNNTTTGQSTLGGNPSGGLFGNKPAGTLGGTGLFNNNTNNTTGGLFGSKPQGATTTLGGGTFGNTNSAASGNGLFGSNQQQGGSTFGATTQLGGGLQTSQQATGQQPGLVQNNPFGTNNLFHQISVGQSNAGPTSEVNITKINADTKKNTALTNAYKLVPKPLFSTQGQAESGHLNSSRKMLTSKPLSLTKESLAGNPEVQNSLLRLADAIFGSRDSEDNSQPSHNILFNPQKTTFKDAVLKRQSEIKTLEASKNAIVKEKESNESRLPTEVIKEDTSIKASTVTPVVPEKATEDVAPANDSPIKQARPTGLTTDDFSLVGEDYYISPSLETISSMSLLELRKVENLIVGNVQYGKIEFLAPVDLSTIPAALICDKYIKFSPEKCFVLANSEENTKPGAGMNVNSRITLLNCYPINRQNRQPITDLNHSLVKRHMEKLRRKPNTKFEKYDTKTGSYTFVVENPIVC